MSNKKQTFIFICQMEEDNSIFLQTKEDVEDRIKECETDERDIDFKTIGRIDKDNINIDMDPNKIEWYDVESQGDKVIIDKTILKIVQHLKYGN